MDFLVKLLGGLVDSFKVKNPVVFGVIQIVLAVLFFLSQQLTLPIGDDPTVFLIASETIRGFIEAAQGFIVAIMALLGAHTPPTFSVKNAVYAKVENK